MMKEIKIEFNRRFNNVRELIINEPLFMMGLSSRPITIKNCFDAEFLK